MGKNSVKFKSLGACTEQHLLSPKEKLMLQVRSPEESPNPWKKGECKLRMPLEEGFPAQVQGPKLRT